MSELGAIFVELGLAQYLDAFVEQGFDTWDTILDITESDLYVPFMHACDRTCANICMCSDALGVKLGHRRVSLCHD